LFLAVIYLAFILVDSANYGMAKLTPELTGMIMDNEERTAWFTVLCVGLVLNFVAILLSGRGTFQGRRLTFVEDSTDQDLFFYEGPHDQTQERYDINY
jgi:uncharacterized membrane protein